MCKVADVYINLRIRKLSKIFTYKVPDNMQIERGNRVYIPFGNSKVEGVVFAMRKINETDMLDANGECVILKEIISVINDDSWDEKNVMDFADWFSKYYLCTPMEALRLFIPGGRSVKKHKIINKEIYQEVVRYCLPIEKEADMVLLIKKRKAHKKFFDILREEKEMTATKLRSLKVDSKRMQLAVEEGWAEIVTERVLRDSYRALSGMEATMVVLTEAQKEVILNVSRALEEEKSEKFLLHGITGSGKTQVYLECSKKARARGKQVLAMVPEIALTGQFVKRFKAVFGDDVAVIHSRLSAGERNDACNRIATGKANVLIGARSAVFAPFTDLGLIIVDEEHERSYRQDEIPHYHAVVVAEELAKKFNAILVLGSATPRIETYYKAKNGEYNLLHLPERISGSFLPEVQIIDMREELKQGRRNVISQSLQTALKDVIAAGEQAILLLNRRGHSTFVLCRDCGFVVKCEDCKIPMVYHLSDQSLRCHYCSIEQAVPVECPQCRNRKIKFFGTGTQKVEEELQKLLPNVRVARMDQDTTKGKWGHEKILDAFAAKQYDVLLGTQMVAKGHDIANVTLVGVISVDTSLQRADFYAAEQTFNLITQAAGRAGRGDKAGRVILQTYNPENYVIQAGAKQDYQLFYEQEIEDRRTLFYPPFSKLLKITCRDANENLVWRKAECIADILGEKIKNIVGRTEMFGPFTDGLKFFKGYYFVHILFKTDNVNTIKQYIVEEKIINESNVIVEIEPV